ncbi:hypothetical protein LCGC14_0664240 [marine sediment metagenome]|uniref:Uncharacterized protein n=1 Tax=marine sediment metagenome TaxID=412755 RepID=A0A0F9U118_9ZZZZ
MSDKDFYNVTIEKQEHCCSACGIDYNVYTALLEACKEARKLYDELARGPLGNAAKFGPDFEPMSDEEILEIRKALESAIATAT